jgi:hypothetical protein
MVLLINNLLNQVTIRNFSRPGNCSVDNEQSLLLVRTVKASMLRLYSCTYVMLQYAKLGTSTRQKRLPTFFFQKKGSS